MNFWLVAATLLLLGFVPIGYVGAKGETLERLVAAEMAGLLSILIVALIAQGTDEPSIYDLALALGLLSFPSAVVFARFFERWL